MAHGDSNNLNSLTHGRDVVLKGATEFESRPALTARVGCRHVLAFRNGVPLVTEWIRPAVILTAVIFLIVANVIEFTGKRRADANTMGALDNGSLPEQLQLKQYRQTQNIEQLLHVMSTLLFAILVALLWT